MRTQNTQEIERSSRFLLRQVFEALRTRKYIILAVTLLGGVLSIFYTYQTEPIFRSTAIITFPSEQNTESGPEVSELEKQSKQKEAFLLGLKENQAIGNLDLLLFRNDKSDQWRNIRSVLKSKDNFNQFLNNFNSTKLRAKFIEKHSDLAVAKISENLKTKGLNSRVTVWWDLSDAENVSRYLESYLKFIEEITVEQILQLKKDQLNQEIMLVIGALNKELEQTLIKENESKMKIVSYYPRIKYLKELLIELLEDEKRKENINVMKIVSPPTQARASDRPLLYFNLLLFTALGLALGILSALLLECFRLESSLEKINSNNACKGGIFS